LSESVTPVVDALFPVTTTLKYGQQKHKEFTSFFCNNTVLIVRLWIGKLGAATVFS